MLIRLPQLAKDVLQNLHSEFGMTGGTPHRRPDAMSQLIDSTMVHWFCEPSGFCTFLVIEFNESMLFVDLVLQDIDHTFIDPCCTLLTLIGQRMLTEAEGLQEIEGQVELHEIGTELNLIGEEMIALAHGIMNPGVYVKIMLQYNINSGNITSENMFQNIDTFADWKEFAEDHIYFMIDNARDLDDEGMSDDEMSIPSEETEEWKLFLNP